MIMPVPTSDEVSCGAKAAVARALAALETHADDPALGRLLDWAWAQQSGHVLGITGPPGVGKSSLISALVKDWRGVGRSVAVIAVDPSSRRTGGALLGDRTRIATDPDDPHVFIRSMAARDRLGGLADITFAAAVILRAVYDRVIVETVGVGQSETEIADLADTVVFCVQPASGDALQFMKAGIMEVPDIALVTKADMGAVADRARADLEGALGLVARSTQTWDARVLTISVQTGQGLDHLQAAVEEHASWAREDGRLTRRRHAQAQILLRQMVRERFGREGVARAEGLPGRLLTLTPGVSPFAAARAVAEALRVR